MATNCCDTELDGVTAHNMILITPVIQGGTMTDTKFAKDCNGNDVFAGDNIATCVDLETKQDQLRAADGTDLAGGSSIYSVGEIDAALAVLDTKLTADIAAAIAALDTLLDDKKQDQLKAADGTDLAAGSVVYTTVEVDAGIALAVATSEAAADAKYQEKLLQCDGTPLPRDAQVPLCSEVAADIATATAGMLTTVATAGEIKGDGTAANPVMLELELSIDAPKQLRGGGNLPTQVMGEKDYLLGAPEQWLVINTESGKMVIPAWHY